MEIQFDLVNDAVKIYSWCDLVKSYSELSDKGFFCFIQKFIFYVKRH